MLALPSVLNLIPLATLAAILLIVGYKLAKPSLFAKMWSDGWTQFVPFMVTVLGIVFTDLLIGIGIGLCAAIMALLVENYSHAYDMKAEESDTLRFSLAQQVTFLNKASILSALAAVPNGATVVIDASESKFVHHDVVEIIDDFVVSAASRDLTVTVLGLDAIRRATPTFGTTRSANPAQPQLHKGAA